MTSHTCQKTYTSLKGAVPLGTRKSTNTDFVLFAKKMA